MGAPTASCQRCQFSQLRTDLLGEIAAAPFKPDPYLAADELDVNLVGLVHPVSGVEIQATTLLSSWEAHTLKRVVLKHWAQGLTPSAYLADLQAVAQQPAVQLWLGHELTRSRQASRKKPLAALVLPAASLRPVAPMLLGGLTDLLFVIYDLTRGVIVTGYPVPKFSIGGRFRGWDKLHLVV